jgi:single-strand DNA-binding protein
MSITSSGVGRFVRDPELKTVGQTVVCEFALAVDERRKIGDKSENVANFFNFVAWDKGAETLVKYCKKGDQIYFEATPRQEKWTDKTTGKPRDKVIFRVNQFKFLAKKQAADSSAPVEEEAPF